MRWPTSTRSCYPGPSRFDGPARRRRSQRSGLPVWKPTASRSSRRSWPRAACDSRYPHAMIVRPMIVTAVWLAGVLAALAALTASGWWVVPAVILLALAGLGTWDLRADQAHHPAGLPDPRSRPVPHGVDPAGDPPVLHRIQHGGVALRQGNPRPRLRAGQGHQGRRTVRHGTRRLRHRLRVPTALHPSPLRRRPRTQGAARRSGLHAAV